MKYLVVFLVLALTSCGHFYKQATTGNYKVGNPYKIGDKLYTPKIQPDYDEVGMASWYGSDFHKKETANGGIFNRNALTAAHRTLPLPSMIKVTNLSNNKTLIVMVNDRGPFSKDRILDLSERAAEILGFKDKGIAKVRVQFLPGQTKRLLADLPGGKGKSYAFAEETFSNKIDIADASDSSITPKVFKASAESIVVNDISAPITASDMPVKLAPAIISGKPASTSKNKAKAKTATIGKNDTVTTDTGLYNDAEDEISVGTGQGALQNATKTDAKIEEIAAEVYYIQAGTYGVMENATRVQKKLAAIGTVNIVPVKINDKLLYKVKIGPILDKKIATLALKKTINLGHPDAITVSENGAAVENSK